MVYFCASIIEKNALDNYSGVMELEVC